MLSRQYAVAITLLLNAIGVMHAEPLRVQVIGPDANAMIVLSNTTTVVSIEPSYIDSDTGAFRKRLLSIIARVCSGGAPPTALMFVDAKPGAWRAIGPLPIQCSRAEQEYTQQIIDSEQKWAYALRPSFVNQMPKESLAEYVIGNALSDLSIPEVTCTRLTLGDLSRHNGDLNSFVLPICEISSRHFGHSLDAYVFASAKIDPQLWANLSSLGLPTDARNDVVRAVLLRAAGQPVQKIPFNRLGGPCEAKVSAGAVDVSGDFSATSSIGLACASPIARTATLYSITIDGTDSLVSERYKVATRGAPPNSITDGWIIGYVPLSSATSSAVWQVDIFRMPKNALRWPAGFEVKNTQVTQVVGGKTSIPGNASFRTTEDPPCVLVKNVTYHIADDSQTCDLWFDDDRYRFALLRIDSDAGQIPFKKTPNYSFPRYTIQAACADIEAAKWSLELQDLSGALVAACKSSP